MGVSLDVNDFLPNEVSPSENIFNLSLVKSGQIQAIPRLRSIPVPEQGLTTDWTVFGSRLLHHSNNEVFDISEWLPADHPHKNQQEAAQAIDTILADRKSITAELTCLPKSFRFYKAFNDSGVAIVSYEQARTPVSYSAIRQLLEDDGIIAIKLGDNERALADILFYLSLSKRFDFNPTFANESMINGRVAFLIWNFVASASPTQAQLSRLIEALENDNEEARFNKNLSSAVAYEMAFINTWERNRSTLIDFHWKPPSNFSDAPRDHLRHRRKQLLAMLIPKGHLRLQKAKRVREWLPYIEASREKGAEAHLKLLEAYQELYAQWEHSTLLEKMFGSFGAYSSVDAFKTLESRNFQSVLLLALKAETYRMEHGVYPESTRLLGAGSYRDLPSEEPLHYEVLPDGTLSIRAKGTLGDPNYNPNYNPNHSLSVREIKWKMSPPETTP